MLDTATQDRVTKFYVRFGPDLGRQFHHHIVQAQAHPMTKSAMAYEVFRACENPRHALNSIFPGANEPRFNPGTELVALTAATALFESWSQKAGGLNEKRFWGQQMDQAMDALLADPPTGWRLKDRADLGLAYAQLVEKDQAHAPRP